MIVVIRKCICEKHRKYENGSSIAYTKGGKNESLMPHELGKCSWNWILNTCSSHILYHRDKQTEKDTTSVHWEWPLSKMEDIRFRHVFHYSYQSGVTQTFLHHSLQIPYLQYTNDHTPFCAYISPASHTR